MNESPLGPPREGKLISGILNDAEEEAKRIVEEAGLEAKRKLDLSRDRAEAVIRETAEKADLQCASIKRIAEQNISIETRRLSLRAREQALSMVLSRVKQKLEALMETPGYRSVLSGWIAEAAMGLSGSEFSVASSAREFPFIDSSLLREAEETVKDLSGRTVRLSADSTPMDAQGVILTSSDRRTAFNNQVPVRLLRYQSQIRKVLYTELFKD